MDRTPSLRELLDYVSTTLDQNDLPHALIGGLSVALRGYPRATSDVDLLVRASDRERLCAVLENAGFLLRAQTAETAHFTGLGAVGVLFAKREPTLKMIDSATAVGESPCRVVLTEDIIGLKIQAYHNDPSRKWQDQADIAELIRANPGLNRQTVLEFAALFDRQAEIQEILDQFPC